MEVGLNWMDRLERHLGFLRIPGLGRYLVGLQALCFVAGLTDARFLEALRLDPSMVAQGELWRLVTFLFLPSLTPFNILFAIFYFSFQWMVFEGLEAEWGAFKLTLYCVLGWLCALALPMLAWAATGQVLLASGGYWSVSIELAFAYLYPEYTIYLFFMLPMKMKWMAWLVGFFLILRVFQSGAAEVLPIGVGLLNYLLFFGPEYVARARHAGQVRQGRQVFQAAKREAAQILGPRACCLCGAGVDADLRLCSCGRCGEDGRLWCAEHLAGHLAENEGLAEASAGPASEAAAMTPKAGPARRGRRPAQKPKGKTGGGKTRP
jgi:hypothetical protein